MGQEGEHTPGLQNNTGLFKTLRIHNPHWVNFAILNHQFKVPHSLLKHETTVNFNAYIYALQQWGNRTAPVKWRWQVYGTLKWKHFKTMGGRTFQSCYTQVLLDRLCQKSRHHFLCRCPGPSPTVSHRGVGGSAFIFHLFPPYLVP